MIAPWIMVGALTFEALFGWPKPLDRRIGHPVRWFGWLVARADKSANRADACRKARIAIGGLVTLLLVALAGAVGAVITLIFADGMAGFVILAIMASSLIATRSLHEHVAAVGAGYAIGGIEAARGALSQIVGRETATLDEAGIARAAIESLAENTSDGVTAPLFWGVVFGLPGLFAYKAINTLDSMIGHRSERYEAFGKIAARLDDVANLIPARLTGLLFAICAASRQSLTIIIRDASKHRSPNAGWPEAAMAGALGVRLSGPRSYGDAVIAEPWLNGAMRDSTMQDLTRALALYRRVVVALAVLLVIGGSVVVA